MPEGTNYRGVFGLTYKPSELLFLQTGIRGSSWISLNKFDIKFENGVKNPVIDILDYKKDISKIER